MSLWEDAENNNNIENINIKEKNLSVEDFREKENRNVLIQDWRESKIIDKVIMELAISLQDESEDNKEKLLENFSENSKLLNSKNSYLNNPIKGIRLISNIIHSKQKQESIKLEKLFHRFSDFLNKDFISFSDKVSIPNETELYKELLNIKKELFESIKFSELINKRHIGIGGGFSAGKSSFLNSILNRDIEADDILPIDSVPTTSIPTYIVKKEENEPNGINIYTFNKNGEKSKIDKESLQAISHEFNKVYNFGLISIIDKIIVDIESMPYSNIAFLDTPGYSKSDGESEIDNNIAQNHLKNIDSMIWLIDADNGVIRNSDIQFIKKLNFSGDILFVINKADKKPKQDIGKIIDVTKENLKKEHITFIDVVAYSSHDKEEYFSTNKIDTFLKDRNKAKVVNFEKKIMDIFNKYDTYLKNQDDKNRQILKLFNQIDLYGNNFISSLDNFSEILSKVKSDVSNNNNNQTIYDANMKKMMEIITTIDKEFNQRISISDKFKAGKYNDVLDYCNQEIQKSIFETKIYLYRARCHYNLKNYNRAIKDYTEIIVLGDDKNPLIYIERGNAYLQISKYKEALLDYENVLKLSPEQEGIIDRINLLKRM